MIRRAALTLTLSRQYRERGPKIARERVMRYGRLSSAYQILNPGFDYWSDDSLDAVAGYVRRGDWWVIGGAPVCAKENEADAARAIEAAAAKDGCRVVYVCVGDAWRQTLLSLGHHAFVTIGAEPVWNPQDWWQRPKESASLRQQLNRASNKHVRVSPLFGDAIAAVADELKPVVVDWLATRPLPAMRFLNDPRSLDGELRDRRAWVARQHGRVVAFLLASPVVQRNGYLFELIARRHSAPNGTVELLIDAAMRGTAATGSTYATLGLVVLSPYAVEAMRKNPLWMRALTEFSRAHGRRFYNYDGLAKFRDKLRPDVREPLHLVANTKPFNVAALYAAGAAFCGDRSPLSVVSRGIGKAVVTEAKWAFSSLSRVLTGEG